MSYSESLVIEKSREHKYKDKDTDIVTETLTVCYIFEILMTQTFKYDMVDTSP